MIQGFPLLLLGCLVISSVEGFLALNGCRLIKERAISNVRWGAQKCRGSSSLWSSAAASPASDNGREQLVLNPFWERLSKPVDPGLHIKLKGKVLNAWGVLYALATFSVAVLVLPFMIVLSFLCDLAGNKKQRRILDWMIHYWAKIVLRMSLCSPKLYGAENLPPPGETVVYVPNHTSFVDILVLSGFVPRPFKYLSKIEIRDIPVIGWAMGLAQHVFLKRDDLKSTIEVSEKCIQRLADGNSMVLFAEGTRSPDGILKGFKKGAFQMAKAAGVRVVPVSIGNLHRWMPPTALLPLAPIRDIFIKIHPPIETKDVPVSAIRAQCHDAVNSGLPPYQQSRNVISVEKRTSEEEAR